MTGGQQTPWENSSLLSEVYLAGRSAIPGLRQAETAYWRTIESSDRLSDYTGFLDRFPSGDFAEIAADRIAALSRGSAAALRSMKECESCPEVVALPAASVVLGAAPNDAEKAPGEIVARRIDVAPFAIGRYQVTFAEWDACVADGGCRTRPDDSGFGRGRRPVINVSWADASAYAAWLSRKTRHRYRLPTEQEWEYAARAGAEGPRIWGGDAARACRFANVSDLNGEKKLRGNGKPHPCDDGFTFTSPVGSFEPNAFGLYDMIGNVWQWTADCWTPAAGGQPCGLRVLRGGSWMSDPSGARVTSRLRTEAADADINIGFRIARDLP